MLPGGSKPLQASCEGVGVFHFVEKASFLGILVRQAFKMSDHGQGQFVEMAQA